MTPECIIPAILIVTQSVILFRILREIRRLQRLDAQIRRDLHELELRALERRFYDGVGVN